MPKGGSKGRKRAKKRKKTTMEVGELAVHTVGERFPDLNLIEGLSPRSVRHFRRVANDSRRSAPVSDWPSNDCLDDSPEGSSESSSEESAHIVVKKLTRTHTGRHHGAVSMHERSRGSAAARSSAYPAFELDALSSKFQERKTPMKKLWEAFGKTNKLTRVITGFMGLGKTELARGYAWKAKQANRYQVIAWFNLKEEESLFEQYKRFAEGLLKCKFSQSSSNGTVVGKVRRFLSENSLSVLMVFDAVSKRKDIELYLRSTGTHKFHALITTRNALFPGENYPLTPFTIEEAKAYIKGRLVGRVVREKEIRELISKLGRLPLALERVMVKLQHDPGFEITEYVRSFDRESAFIEQKLELESGYNPLLLDEAQTIAKALLDECPELEILWCCALINHTNIPRRLLGELAGKSVAWVNSTLIPALQKQSLVKLGSGEKRHFFNLEPLVQRMLRLVLVTGGVRTLRYRSGQLATLLDALEKVWRESSCEVFSEVLVSHIEAVLEHDEAVNGQQAKQLHESLLRIKATAISKGYNEVVVAATEKISEIPRSREENAIVLAERVLPEVKNSLSCWGKLGKGVANFFSRLIKQCEVAIRRLTVRALEHALQGMRGCLLPSTTTSAVLGKRLSRGCEDEAGRPSKHMCAEEVSDLKEQIVAKLGSRNYVGLFSNFIPLSGVNPGINNFSDRARHHEEMVFRA